MGWGLGAVPLIEHLPSMHGALGLGPIIETNKQNPKQYVIFAQKEDCRRK